MKTVEIYSRTIRERKLYRVFKYVDTKQISVFFSGEETKNHSLDIRSPRIRIPFVKVFATDNKNSLKSFLFKLGGKKEDEWLKRVITDILKRS